MRRTNEQGLGEVLREFFENNIEIHEKIMAVRIERAWKKYWERWLNAILLIYM